jgi:steroid delta-isomerase-like uncharacterized protein
MKEGEMKKYLYVVPLVILFCLSIACQDKSAMAELEKHKAQAVVEEQNLALVKRLVEEENKGNAEIVKELYGADVKAYYPSGSTAPLSRNGSYESTKAYLDAFPDLYQTVEELVASGDKVIARINAKGTHKGDFQGIPATGNQITVSVIIIWHIKDGRIVEEREELDALGMMMQLGMELKPKEPAK